MSLESIRANFKRLAEGLPILAGEGCEAGAEVVLQADKNLLFPGHGYDTGALHDAQIEIEIENSATRVSWGVGTDQEAEAIVAGKAPPKEYDLPVEFGTSKMDAIPHLRPAIEENRDAVLSAIHEKIKAGVDKIVK